MSARFHAEKVRSHAEKPSVEPGGAVEGGGRREEEGGRCEEVCMGVEVWRGGQGGVRSEVRSGR